MPDSTALECLCKWESGICKDPPTHLGSLKTPAGRPLLLHAKEKLVTIKGGRAFFFFSFFKSNITEENLLFQHEAQLAGRTYPLAFSILMTHVIPVFVFSVSYWRRSAVR